MPRGQYDRSKSKEQRAAEKEDLQVMTPSKTQAPTKKVRAPYGSKKKAAQTVQGVVTSSSVAAPVVAQAAVGAEIYSLEQWAQLRGICSAPLNEDLTEKIDAIMMAKLDKVLEKIAPAATIVPTNWIPAPVAQQQVQMATHTPMAFNPPVPPNGQS